MHSMTLLRLLQTGLEEHFDHYYLNDEKSGSLFKCRTVAKKLKEDENGIIIDLEDDPKAGKAVGDVDEERVVVFLKENLATNPRLLKRGGLILSRNVISVKKVSDAPKIVAEMLRTGKI